MHIGTPSLPGQHMKMAIENVQLELGMSTQFFSIIVLSI